MSTTEKNTSLLLFFILATNISENIKPHENIFP